MISFDEYCMRVQNELNVKFIVTPSKSDRLLEDLGWDSLLVLDLIIFSEQLADLLLPPDAEPVILTLGDAYDYYAKSLVKQSSEDHWN